MNKAVKALLTSAVLILLLCLCAGFSYAEGTQMGTVNVSVLRLRSGPSLSYRIIGSLDKGQQVTVLSQSDDWTKIQTPSGNTAWTYSKYLSKAAASTSKTVTSLKTSSVTKAQLEKVTASSLKLRGGPGLTYKTVGKLDEGSMVTVLSQSGNWTKIQTSSGNSAWAYSDYLSKVPVSASSTTVSSKITSTADTQMGKVTASSLKLRSGPGLTYKTVGNLIEGNTVTVLNQSGNWSKVQTSSGNTAWAYTKYLCNVSAAAPKATAVAAPAASTPKAVFITAATNTAKAVAVTETSRSSESQTLGEELVSYAKRFIGVPYVWGGSSPDGFDCSGFVKYVYGNFGIELYRVAADQATEGTLVSKSNLQPGDLVFFDTDGGHNYINHTGMYIGDGKFIQASSGHGSVIISDITSGFYAEAFMTARRLIK